ALKNGIDIINPLHVDFGKIDELSKKLGGTRIDSTESITKFNEAKGQIHNIRIPPEDIELFSMKVLNTNAKRVLAVGSDCNIGKMLTSLELNSAANKKGLRSEFIATGQIGMLIKGEGIAIDRVISDFVPGSVEKLILEKRDRDILFVEGQGSIFQPLYSAVTMGLIHGTAPDAMILCHLPSRKKIRYTDLDMPDYPRMIKMYEDLAGIVNKSKIVGISLNCHDMTDEEAKLIIEKTEKETGLPTTDPVKFGVDKLLKSLLNYLKL
ncbi:MAG: NAD-dependent epimerase/dehydratase family protein, partial [bacterium]